MAEGGHLVSQTFENIHFNGKPITVKSTDPSDPDTVAATIIACSESGRVVTFSSDEDADTVLRGFLPAKKREIDEILPFRVFYGYNKKKVFSVNFR